MGLARPARLQPVNDLLMVCSTMREGMLLERASHDASADFVGGRICLDFTNTVHNYERMATILTNTLPSSPGRVPPEFWNLMKIASCGVLPGSIRLRLAAFSIGPGD